MHYYELDVIKGVDSFSVRGNDLVVAKAEGIYLNGQELMATDINAGFYNVGFFLNDDSIAYGHLDSFIRLYPKENRKQPLQGHWTYYWETLTGNKVIISNNHRKLENGQRIADYYQYDFETDRLVSLNLTEHPTFYYRNGHAFVIERNKLIRKYDLNDSTQMWGIDLFELTSSFFKDGDVSIRQFIGIQGNELLLSLCNDELLSLDVRTGQVLWHTAGFVANHLKDFRNQSLCRFSYWHLEGDKLYELDGNRYLSVDLHTRQVDMLWDDTRKEGYITVAHKTYTRDYIYFTASLDYRISPDIIGVFNRRSLKIDWLSKVDNLKDSLNQPPVIEGDRLYVIDSGKVLYVLKNSAVS